MYRSEVGTDADSVTAVRAEVGAFAAARNLRRHILVARWARTATTVARGDRHRDFADLGFDVDIGPLFQTPGGRAGRSGEDVHVVGVSSLAAGHLTLVPELRGELAALGRPDIAITVGGVIPPDDVPTLLEMGAVAVYPPGTVIADAALELLARLA
ncbi:MAG: hypothetical protein R2695_09930 [Acidimicrobiales bacterium]